MARQEETEVEVERKLRYKLLCNHTRKDGIEIKRGTVLELTMDEAAHPLYVNNLDCLEGKIR